MVVRIMLAQWLNIINCHKMSKLYFVFLFLSIAGFACKDKPEAIPAYLKVEPFKVTAEGGAAWQKITEGWIYVNREFLGAYTLPHTFPVLAEGDTEIWVLAGVKENGSFETPGVNYFFKRFEQQYNLTPGETTTVQPVTNYDVPTVKFAWEPERTTFDGTSSLIFEDRDNDLELNVKYTTVGSFAGRSLLMEVDSAHAGMIIVSEPAVVPILAERQTWLELHYRNEAVFSMWLIGKSDGEAAANPTLIYQFNPTKDNTWNKIYLNLTEFLQYSAKQRHQLMFRLDLPRDAAGKYTRSKAAVLLDNIRLVHF